MLLKIFLYRLFFLMFLSLICCDISLSMSFQKSNKNFLFKNQYYLNIDSNKKKLFFLDNSKCFSFLKLKKNFIKQDTLNISNKNFIGIFQEDRFKIFYIVQSKDTLYSIAKNSGYSYYELSKFNSIKKPYKIIVGQKIWIGDFLINEVKNNCFILNLNKEYISCQKIFNKKFKVSNFFKRYREYKTSKICFFYNNIVNKKHSFVKKKYFNLDKKWDWPIKSKHIQYEYHNKSTNKEIEFFGFKGQPVFAAASGKVVFITDIFKKYGRLIILKHNQNYLSIYAFNDVILVKQEEQVRINQQISTMGLSQKKIPQLYFEIRYRGESINPLNVLSKNDIKD